MLASCAAISCGAGNEADVSDFGNDANGPHPADQPCGPNPTTPCTLDVDCGGVPCPMVFVPAGEFFMGCNSSIDTNCRENEGDAQGHGQTVFLDEFYIDLTEVTVAQYQACIEAGHCQVPPDCRFDEIGHCTLTRQLGSQPINAIRWPNADTYCRWARKELPTEAQWEKAARGTDGRIYPWGSDNTPCAHAATLRADKLAACRDPEGNPLQGFAEILEFELDRGPYGAYGMAGNATEWVSDKYSAEYFDKPLPRNPTGPTGGEERTQKGGSINGNIATVVRLSHRAPLREHASTRVTGFRCSSPVPVTP